MNNRLSFIVQNVKKFRFNSVIIRTFIIILLILMIPISAFNCVFYLNNKGAIEKEIDVINKNNLTSTKAIVEATIREAEVFAIQTSVYPDIEGFILASENDMHLPECQRKVMDYTKQFSYVRKYIHSVYVFSENSNSIIANNSSFDYRKYEDDGWYLIYEKMGLDETVILPRKYADRYPKFISVIRTVGIPNIGKRGCVVVNIDVEQMNKNICNTYEKSNIYKFFVVNKGDKILYSNVLSAVGKATMEIEELAKDVGEYSYSSVDSEKYEWTYISLMCMDSMATANKNMRSQMLISIIILAILACVVAVITSMELSEPFHNILETLSTQHSIDDGVEPKLKQNEIRLIIDSIKATKGKNLQLESELQYRMIVINRAQAFALQAQINPHFLNNMLEITNWTAIDLLGKSNKVSTMLKALSTLLAISLDFENYLIPIKEELQHINVYSYLIGLGFEEKFNLVWEIEPDVEKYKILKLTLQPLLENVVYHGIGQNENPIYVHIKGEINERGLLFTVSDNGVGIEPEKLKKIQQSLKESDSFMKKHIGLINVNKRIKLICGDRYGVSIDSVFGKGTTVWVSVPKLIDEVNENN